MAVLGLALGQIVQSLGHGFALVRRHFLGSKCRNGKRQNRKCAKNKNTARRSGSRHDELLESKNPD
jgi:hypothetical protein